MQFDHLHEGDVDQQLLVRFAGEVQPLVIPQTLQPPNKHHNAIAIRVRSRAMSDQEAHTKKIIGKVPGEYENQTNYHHRNRQQRRV